MNNFFDKIYCINLQERVDRKEHFINQIKIQSEPLSDLIDVEFFQAINGKKCGIKPGLPPRNFSQINSGELGCLLSHREIIKQAKEFNYKSILILEDDVEFAPPQDIQFYLNNVPTNWDMLYFGGNHRGKISPIDKYCARCSHTLTTHAVAIKSNLFDTILSTTSGMNIPIDVSYALLHNIYTVYTPIKPLAWQIESFSDINMKTTSYEHLK